MKILYLLLINFVFAIALAFGANRPTLTSCQADFNKLSLVDEEKEHEEFLRRLRNDSNIQSFESHSSAIYDLPDQDVLELHEKLLKTNAEYNLFAKKNIFLQMADEVFQRGTLNGKPRPREYGVEQLRHLLIDAFDKLGKNILVSSPETTVINTLVQSNPTFKLWLSTQALPKGWQNEPQKMQGFMKKILLDWEELSKKKYTANISANSEEIIREAQRMLKLKNLNIKNNDQLFELPDDAIDEIHKKLLEANQAYALLAKNDFSLKMADEILKTGKLNGSPRTKQDAYDQVRMFIQRAVRDRGPGLFEVSEGVEQVGKLADENPQFLGWLVLRQSSLAWKKNPAALENEARAILSEWDREVVSRYIPKKAVASETRINPTFEKVSTQALVDKIKYVASEDGKYWVALANQPNVSSPLLLAGEEKWTNSWP